ncbi:Phosphatidylinositol 4-kinase stt4 [Elasticomyces elasticus]|nr:Phosphatidylinositol 4-kinase stt4 [Elasticomyces elasticus]
MRPRPGLRRNALEKLATLSAQPTTGASYPPDLNRLCKQYNPPAAGANGTSTPNGVLPSATPEVPMSLRELEVLLALCKAAPLVRKLNIAESLLHQLTPYLPEAHTQDFPSSAFHQRFNPSPWEVLTHQLTSAVLSLGLNHPSLRSSASDTVQRTVLAFTQSAQSLVWSYSGEDDDADHLETEHSTKSIMLSVSLVGFLEAIAKYARFWSPSEAFDFMQELGSILSEKFMVAVEGALSSLRNTHGHQRSLKDWKAMLRHYAASSRPLGAMLLQQGFMHFVAASASLLVIDHHRGLDQGLLDVIIARNRITINRELDDPTLDGIADLAEKQMSLLDADSDYLQLSSAWQQRLAFTVKAYILETFLCCSLVDDDIADTDVLMGWLESLLMDPIQLADESLASVALKCMAVLSRSSSTIAASRCRFLSRFLVQSRTTSTTAAVAAQCLAVTLKSLPEDSTISTLYSLGNVLSAASGHDRALNASPFFDSGASTLNTRGPYSHPASGSAISLIASDEETIASMYGTIVRAIVTVACSCKDEKITALAISMLAQKLGRISPAVDAEIVTETASLSAYGGPSELKSLLKLYSTVVHQAIERHDDLTTNAAMKARVRLASSIHVDSPLYEVYAIHLCDAIVSKGDAHEGGHTREQDAKRAAEEIAQLLRPLAVLVTARAQRTVEFEDEKALHILGRDAWFNIVVHNFGFSSPLGQKYMKELQVLARHTRPLIDEDRADTLESDIETNTVLRRGMNAQHAVEQKAELTKSLPSCEADIRSLAYAEVIFLRTAHLLASLQAESGECTKSLSYFLDPKLKNSPMGNCMFAIALQAVDAYLGRSSRGIDQRFSISHVAEQLLVFFQGCCHRISKVQQVAFSCADRIISQIPSALCQRTSLFALLELLSIMARSCLDAECDPYQPMSMCESTRGGVSVRLSDDYAFRQTTLSGLYKRARVWVLKAVAIAPFDVKGLLQTYLSDYIDDEPFGEVSLGRSFASEMGSIIPLTDRRLGAVGQLNGNAASAFVAQLADRQRYRKTGTQGMSNGDLNGKIKNDEARDMMKGFEPHVLMHKEGLTGAITHTLRSATASLYCPSNRDCSLAQFVVGVPFTVFTKHSIKLGISLWSGIIQENPSMESRILLEIAMNWEKTVRNKQGLFNPALQHPDPFYIKEEFAPSNAEALTKRRQVIQDMLESHYQLVQFLSSRFHATRLLNGHVERTYHRMMHVTLKAMRHGTGHPLARELHFQLLSLALDVLRLATGSGSRSRWALKDQVLSSGLAWFRFAPRWSYGGDQLRLKAEIHILSDVLQSLQSVADIGSRPSSPLQPLQSKQALLVLLLNSEISRLNVWLHPLDIISRGILHYNQHASPVDEAALLKLLPTAWLESPSLFVQLVTRFQSQSLVNDVRMEIICRPEKFVDEPDALTLLIGPSLPRDVNFQLKYLLYWAPVNPITAVTYFLPAYGNHPLIIQYAMRALESHSVDVTFFYVPQIVQTLRYDVLGYVERYIIETAKFSQLFAHQIIWNIKANAYKDEDSQVPDPMKPKLDDVTDALISSLSEDDKSFYEREFTFFNEVTSISGKLKPFIKRPKPEKKQKIEEELRKIQVDVGVYLPSNPDGVVIGIDRKSGKPLQSHAKAPFMATFRIRKELGDMEATEAQVEESAQNGEPSKSNTYEVWQSAIFKVGDDCRQDVLALQMIAAFRGIFNDVGLEVYVFPYRVTATAPGCGVIDVLPNSISRDMMGREAVNGLYSWFVSKFGSEDSIRFQEARINFVKSMAAYSVISYLLQFKDRHNGNIMLDDAGHILHIDFGFCFDIAPGGVRFERAPFKLTAEMVAVMGGSTTAQPYRWFEELCVKAFLASRQHAEKLCHIVLVMLDSGLPCFKPETIQHLRERFVLDKTEREAAEFMRMLVHRSERSYSTKGYDQFQLLTNGIPY